MNEVQTLYKGEIVEAPSMTITNRLEIIEEGLRKNYLARLSEMRIAPIGELIPLEEDLIDNVRLYYIDEMVYKKGEPVTDKFTTVFNTIATYNASVFVILDSDGKKTDFYVGVRNNEFNEKLKRSTVTLGDTLKNTLIGHFPGTKIHNRDRRAIANLCGKIAKQQNVASVSIIGSSKSEKEQTNEQFVQGIEKLALAMEGRQYIGIIIAENQSPQSMQVLRSEYQNLYTKLSPYQKVQFSEGESSGTSSSKPFSEMTGKQKAAMIGGAAVSLAGVAGGALLGGKFGGGALLATGSMIGGQAAGQLSGFISSLAPTEQITKGTNISTSTTTENKAVTDLLKLLDESINENSAFEFH